MIVYTVIMFVAAIVFSAFAVLISKGHTNLINCYHEDRVKDKPLYCKKFSRSLWILAAVLAASGVIGMLGETDTIALSAVGVLIIGLVGGIIRIFCVQKNYGGGVF